MNKFLFFKLKTMKNANIVSTRKYVNEIEFLQWFVNLLKYIKTNNFQNELSLFRFQGGD